MVNKIIVGYYKTETGKIPFELWLSKLDGFVKRIVIARLFRISKTGNFGDCDPVGNAISEIKFRIRSGHRIYFGKDGLKKIVLLSGGNKKTQKKDIKISDERWIDYKLHRRERWHTPNFQTHQELA